MTFAVHDLKYVALPVGWDAAYLRNFRLADGVTFDRIVAEIEAALVAFNNEAAWYDNFITITPEPEVEYAQGDLKTEAHSEYVPPRPQRPDFTGHMLPVLERDVGLRFTRDFLVKGRFSRVQATIRKSIDAWRQYREYLIIRRALRRADDIGASKGLGASGISPGFATDAANTGVNYQPPRYGGKAFTTAHDHYLGYTAANLDTGLKEMIRTLREHGHAPPFELWVSSTDAPTVAALGGFNQIQPTNQIFGDDTARSALPADTSGDVPYLIGTYGDGQSADANVRVVPRMPDNYYFLARPYGFGDMLSPFHVRYDPRWGSEGVMHIADKVAYPLADSYLFEAKGVGVGEDRTNGVAMFIDAGAAWVDATVSE